MKKKFNLLIILSLIFGIILGLYLPNIANKLSFIGTIYINLLKFIIIPVVFTSLSVTIYENINKKSKLIFKTILTFLIMFISTFLLTSLIVTIINPSKGINPNLFSDSSITLANLSISEVITNLFPSNIFTMVTENSVFQVILFSSVFGICASKIESGKKIMDMVKAMKDLFNKLLEYIMYLTPFGVLFLIGSTISNYGTSIVFSLFKYILVAYLCSIIVLIIIMILPVSIITKINPFKYIKELSKVWLITISTCSSMATLPYTIKVCSKLNIKEDITDVVVPLGCTIHMCGGAVSFALLGLFSASLFNIDINFSTYLLMIISSTLINMAAPGIPNGGVVLGATYLSILNIPLTFIASYSTIYKVLDMAYTTLNVTGDISANMIINHIEKKRGAL